MLKINLISVFISTLYMTCTNLQVLKRRMCIRRIQQVFLTAIWTQNTFSFVMLCSDLRFKKPMKYPVFFFYFERSCDYLFFENYWLKTIGKRITWPKTRRTDNLSNRQTTRSLFVVFISIIVVTFYWPSIIKWFIVCVCVYYQKTIHSVIRHNHRIRTRHASL